MRRGFELLGLIGYVDRSDIKCDDLIDYSVFCVFATYSVFFCVVAAELCVTRRSLIVKTVTRDNCYLTAIDLLVRDVFDTSTSEQILGYTRDGTNHFDLAILDINEPGLDCSVASKCSDVSNEEGRHSIVIDELSAITQ
jgi:hypothetical protein